MNQTKLLKTITLALTALVIAACANTKPVGEWSNEQFTGKLNNILIIGVTSRSDRRRVFEDKFVEGLAALKVNATPSYKLMDSSLHLTRQVVENAIKGQDVGAVLVTRLAGIKEKDVYRAPDNQDENLSGPSYWRPTYTILRRVNWSGRCSPKPWMHRSRVMLSRIRSS
jgi:hypothetical protein